MSDTSIDRGGRNQVEVWISGATVSVLGVLCVLILRPFISAMLWALILCFTTWPLFLKLEQFLGGRRTLSALIATLFLATVIALPVAILGATLAENVSSLFSASQKLIREGPQVRPTGLRASQRSAAVSSLTGTIWTKALRSGCRSWRGWCLPRRQ